MISVYARLLCDYCLIKQEKPLNYHHFILIYKKNNNKKRSGAEKLVKRVDRKGEWEGSNPRPHEKSFQVPSGLPHFFSLTI